jgi:hypothetical protein
MNSVPIFIAALGLLATAPQARPVPAADEVVKEVGAREEPTPYRDFRDSYQPDPGNQVRIQQRLVIRISPRPPSARQEMFARLDGPPRYQEKKLHGCIAIEDIAGAQPAEENRLLLFMRDHRVLSAALERACDADDFYLGFYIAQNDDGMLCTKRDKLHARTGPTCRVERLSRLVAIKD